MTPFNRLVVSVRIEREDGEVEVRKIMTRREYLQWFHERKEYLACLVVEALEDLEKQEARSFTASL